MARHAQLEIVRPDGAVVFVALDSGRGFTNIGRHPENDVVLESEGIADFHALIDHREYPFQLTLLAEQETRLDGTALSPQRPAPLAVWSTLEIDGHTLILIEDGHRTAAAPIPTAAPASVPTPAAVPASSQAAVATTTEPRPTQPASPASRLPQDTSAPVPAPAHREPLPGLPVRPVDVVDDYIITTLSPRELVIDVEQTAAFVVEITNGGPLVATFKVHVEGVPQAWITISPEQINLNENEHGTVSIAITPPRHPSSRAGDHHLAIVITSPDHPGRTSQRGATLTLNPYYAFAVSDLDPKQQTVGGRNPRGTSKLHIANKGNSRATFRLEAIDPQRACTFEFEVPGESTPLAQQAETQLPPEETFVIPIHATPQRRPVLAMRKERHAYTVNVTLTNHDEQIPRSMLGELLVRPLIGPFMMALIALFLGVFILLVFRPRIREFSASALEIEAGEEVTFSYQTSALARRWIETDRGRVVSLDTATGRYIDAPTVDTIYTLRAENLLSQLFGFLSPKQDPITIDVVPLEPRIAFTVDRPTLVAGETATLRWEVVNADDVVLSINGQAQTLAPSEYTAQRALTPQETTHYEIRATNGYGSQAVASLSVEVKAPTPTPLPLPLIQRFSVEPRTIFAGESVTITWEAENATHVDILGEEFPPIGETVQTLNEIGVVEYTLIAIYDDETGIQTPARRNSAPVRVNVLEKPTPTPEPEVPEIEVFNVVPASIVLGDGQAVQLVWSVVGEFTNIEISGPTISPLSNLAAKGSIPVSAEQTTFFMLTAYNGDLSATATAELTVGAPPPPTPVPPPDPIIEYFELHSANANSRDVEEISNDGTTRVYEVTQNAPVVFSWSAANVDQVILTGPDGPAPRAPAGSYNTIIRTPGDYTLEATNEADVSAFAYIEIRLRPVEIPPPPYNVRGTFDGPLPPPEDNPKTLRWSYNPNYIDAIIGFRVYRKATSDPLFDRVADEAHLGPTHREWVEPEPLCGQVYHVRAVYIDINGDRQETQPSTNYWHSWPCATPTP